MCGGRTDAEDGATSAPSGVTVSSVEPMKRPTLLSLSCLLVACASGRDPARSLRPVEANPFEVVRRGGDALTSFRAQFVSTMTRGDVSERARGVLLVSKPERFRLRLSSLLGFTILDYTSDAGNDRLWLASENRALEGEEISRSGWFSTESVRWIFLREDTGFQRDCRQLAAGVETMVECRDERGGVAYRGYVDNGSNLLFRETVFDGATPRLTVEYRDYRAVQGVRLPYKIEWTEGANGVRVEIDVDRYEVDATLPPHLFAPVPP